MEAEQLAPKPTAEMPAPQAHPIQPPSSVAPAQSDSSTLTTPAAPAASSNPKLSPRSDSSTAAAATVASIDKKQQDALPRHVASVPNMGNVKPGSGAMAAAPPAKASSQTRIPQKSDNQGKWRLKCWRGFGGRSRWFWWVPSQMALGVRSGLVYSRMI